MTPPARFLGGARSLRTRLLVAFALLGVCTAALVAGVGYVQARDAILQRTQDAAVLTLTERIETLNPIGAMPPSQATLDEIAARLSDGDDHAVAVYRDRRSAPGLDPDLLPPELRHAVGDGRVVWQRVSMSGHPVLVIGTQLGSDSELEVYSVRSLAPEQLSIGRLATQAWLTGAVALVFAVLLALLAGRGVLGPVRELRRATNRLGEGDLTARARVQGTDELADVAAAFNDTAQTLERHVGELRRMEAEARRFVADVSHELRTPLAAMIAVTDVLDAEADRLPGDAGQAARLVSAETHQLTRLGEDLMEVSRFDAGTATLVLDDVDVAEAVRATLRARGWSERVRTDLPGGVLARVDPRRLDVIVANLVSNALRHGGPPVSVRAHVRPDHLDIEVGDSGPGLAADVLPHVFDRFYKADTARTRSEGSGLGLAIAWENARLHGGALTAANHPDGGAVFTFHLPRPGATR
ncbi:HAMP domain-containing sensor histidine kinase [Actinophytocola sp.]|uniref:HAMP domain-containing sensor histidine kinase n=1 Tax=Actinophytocola sp. TaxID=1872138 RepID=UPI002D7FE4D5|nr:HAMP domain-containing sensor histidine kinase [Actinophytocola sp.]HET9139566.1 HAMP domain-containing sensor histidine kinase [Actinophytocola sp.]